MWIRSLTWCLAQRNTQQLEARTVFHVVTRGVKAKGKFKKYTGAQAWYPETRGSWSPGGMAGRDFWGEPLKKAGDASSAPKEVEWVLHSGDGVRQGGLQ